MNTKKQTQSMVLAALFTAIIIIMATTPLGYIPLGVINATIIHIPVILGALFLGPKIGAFLGGIFGLTSLLRSTLTPDTVSAFVFSPVISASQFGPLGALKSIFICFVPRILVGIIPYFVYLFVRKISQGSSAKVKITLLDALISLIAYAGISQLVSREMDGGYAVIAVVIAAVIFAVLMVFSLRTDTKFTAYAYAGLSGALTNTLLVMPLIYLLYRDAYAAATGVAKDALLGVILGIIGFNGVMEAALAAVIIALVSAALVHVLPVYANRK